MYLSVFNFIIYCIDMYLFVLCNITVMGGPKGPTPNSEFEHSSIPATIKKMFNLSSNFLTHRDAWAGTFEEVVGQLTSPRTDCPGMLLVFANLRFADHTLLGVICNLGVNFMRQ